MPAASSSSPKTQGSTPPIIGLTGAIGSGKSAVASILREQGCVVADSDALAKQALLQPEIRDALVRWWGPGVLNPATGEIQRSAIASIVFADPEQRRRLEALTHPWIEARRKEQFAAAPPFPQTPALVIDAPLLIEAGIHTNCDAVVFVDADPATRLERLKSTRNWDAAEVARRESAQLPLDEKRRLADHVVVNNGTWNELQDQVMSVLRSITQTSRGPLNK